MRYHFYRFLLPVNLLFALAFNLSAGNYSANNSIAFGTSQTMSLEESGQFRETRLDELTKRYNLRLYSRSSSNQILLYGKGIKLTLIPGMSRIVFNQRIYNLSQPLQYSRGRLIVPARVLRLLPPPEPENKLSKLITSTTVIVDPGHGGHDFGATGYRSMREKDINLKVSLYLSRYLKSRGIKVKLTRRRDYFLSLQQRANIANAIGNSIFVSIHANSAKDHSARGVETFVLSRRISNKYRARKATLKYKLDNAQCFNKNKEKVILDKMCRYARGRSLDLAQYIQTKLVSATRETNRGIRQKNLHVLRENYFAPAVLVEVGFISNATTARKLAQTSYLKSVADSISSGIASFLLHDADSNSTVCLDKNSYAIPR